MTYAKLKEMGYDHDDWKDWNQEQANEIVAKGRKETENNKQPDEKETTTESKYKPNSSKLESGSKTEETSSEFSAESWDNINEVKDIVRSKKEPKLTRYGMYFNSISSAIPIQHIKNDLKKLGLEIDYKGDDAFIYKSPDSIKDPEQRKAYINKVKSQFEKENVSRWLSDKTKVSVEKLENANDIKSVDKYFEQAMNNSRYEREYKYSGVNDKITNYLEKVKKDKYAELYGMKDNPSFNDVNKYYLKFWGSRDWRTEDAVDAVVHGGMYLNRDLSAGGLDYDQHKLKESIENSMIKSPANLTTYRTDSTNWLKDMSEGENVDIGVFIGSSPDKNLTTSENVGQKIVFNVPKYSDIMTTDNGKEKEIVIGGKNQTAKVSRIEKDENGIPVYYLDIVSK